VKRLAERLAERLVEQLAVRLAVRLVERLGGEHNLVEVTPFSLFLSIAALKNQAYQSRLILHFCKRVKVKEKRLPTRLSGGEAPL
jgi:hypothetical protein